VDQLKVVPKVPKLNHALAGERELDDLGLRQRDDQFAAGRALGRVLEPVVLDQPSQEGQLSKIRLAGLLDKHLQC
jgi:hypothetical protein